MYTHAWLKSFSAKWWGLPLLLPLMLLPISRLLSARLHLAEGDVYLLFLPLAMMVALLMVFDWAALPGIALALAWHYGALLNWVPTLAICSVFLTALSSCWLGYRAYAGRHWGISVGGTRLMSVHLLWFGFFLPALFVALLQLIVTLSIVPEENAILPRSPFAVRTLINYLSVLLSCVSMIPLYYCLLRIFKNPRFARQLIQQIKRQIADEVTRGELFGWIVLLILLLLILTGLGMVKDNFRVGDYALVLLLPMMLWASARFGYLLTSLSWSLILIILCQFREQFLANPVFFHHLAVVSSNLIVFTLTFFLLSVNGTRQRHTLNKTRRAALIDPIIDLPNLRALGVDLAKYSHSTLCFLRIPELDVLSRTYGLRLRIQYKRSLADHLRPLLQRHEGIYQLPGFDLVLRIDKETHHLRIEEMATQLNDYHLTWDGLPLQPDVGISYCHVKPPVAHLYELLGEMSAMAEVSLHSRRPEDMQQGNVPVENNVREKVMMLHEVQRALETDSFVLLAQRIQGRRGDDYHEILLRMVDSHGEQLKPDRFLPVVRECGMTWEIDHWVLEKTLAFIDTHRHCLPAARFSINLFADSLCRPHLAHDINTMLMARNIEPWQLVIEVEESPILSDSSWGNRSISRLRQMGCRVAIDDFGTGYASYMRLKEVQADILKIDGSFICNMLDSSLDYQIIESIYRIARLKRMKVVAKSVESNEVAEALKKMGIDYLQGYAIGEPQPLLALSRGEPAQLMVADASRGAG